MTEPGAMRISNHPILEPLHQRNLVSVTVDGRALAGYEGETISALLFAHGINQSRTMPTDDAPRGYFCGVGRCADCAMTVDGDLNVMSCKTPIHEGMVITTQKGLGSWGPIE